MKAHKTLILSLALITLMLASVFFYSSLAANGRFPSASQVSLYQIIGLA